MHELPSDLLNHVNEHFVNRTEVGLVCWRARDNDGPGYYYDYRQTVAIACMMLRGWSLTAAATLVDYNLIRAHPHVPGYEVPRCEYEDFILSVGFVQLTDRAIWEVIADIDIAHAKEMVESSSSVYGHVATRGLQPSDDDVSIRLSHLVSTGRLDPVFGFVPEVIKDRLPV